MNLAFWRRIIFCFFLILSFIGVLFTYSASSIYAFHRYHDQTFFLRHHLIYLFIAILSFFIALNIDFSYLRRHNRILFLFNIFLLFLVLAVGRKSGGAQRWLSLGGIQIQPSEFLKITFSLYVIDYLIRKRNLLTHFRKGLLPLLIILVLVSSLLLAQPDLGSVVFWLAWSFIVFFLAGARKKHLLGLFVVGFAVIIILILIQPYRIARLFSYLDPWQDPQGKGFQAIQSQICFSQGKLFGVGLGAGKQKLLFLPAAHTDFIFAQLAEEWGFIGAFGVLLIYFISFSLIFLISLGLKDKFLALMGKSIAIIIGLETIINIGVSCGLLPTKGMTLPFLSYGGTSLLVHYFLLGMFFSLTKGVDFSMPYLLVWLSKYFRHNASQNKK